MRWKSVASKRGVAALCIGGGEATAIAVERLMSVHQIGNCYARGGLQS